MYLKYTLVAWKNQQAITAFICAAVSPGWLWISLGWSDPGSLGLAIRPWEQSGT